MSVFRASVVELQFIDTYAHDFIGMFLLKLNEFDHINGGSFLINQDYRV